MIVRLAIAWYDAIMLIASFSSFSFFSLPLFFSLPPLIFGKVIILVGSVWELKCFLGMNGFLLWSLNRAGAPSSEAAGFNPDGSAVNPSAFQQQVRSDSNLMAQLFQVL